MSTENLKEKLSIGIKEYYDERKRLNNILRIQKEKNKLSPLLLEAKNLINNKYDYNSADELLIKIIELDQNNLAGFKYLALIERGIIKRNKREFKESIRFFNSAIKLEPLNITAFKNRCFAYGRNNQIKKMFTDAYKIIELDPSSFEGYKWLGWAKMHMRDFAGAIDSYSKAILLEPLRAELYQSRSYYNEQLNNFEDALEDLNSAVKLSNSEALLEKRANLKIRINMTKSALSDYNKILKLKPKSAYFHMKRAFLKLDLFDCDGALLDFEKYISFSGCKREFIDTYSFYQKLNCTIEKQQFADFKRTSNG